LRIRSKDEECHLVLPITCTKQNNELMV
jgi:hypothetical protein